MSDLLGNCNFRLSSLSEAVSSGLADNFLISITIKIKVKKRRGPLTCHGHISKYGRGGVQKLCLAGVLSRMFWHHVVDQKCGRYFVALPAGVRFTAQARAGTQFSPCDTRPRKTFNPAGQIQNGPLFQACMTNDHRFPLICEANSFNNEVSELTRCG